MKLFCRYCRYFQEEPKTIYDLRILLWTCFRIITHNRLICHFVIGLPQRLTDENAPGNRGSVMERVNWALPYIGFCLIVICDIHLLTAM